MTTTSTAAGVELVGLHESSGPVRAVRGIDLRIAAGETVTRLGPDRAGKSTTVDHYRQAAGVTGVERRGAGVLLSCVDSNQAIRA